MGKNERWCKQICSHACPTTERTKEMTDDEEASGKLDGSQALELNEEQWKDGENIKKRGKDKKTCFQRKSIFKEYR